MRILGVDEGARMVTFASEFEARMKATAICCANVEAAASAGGERHPMAASLLVVVGGELDGGGGVARVYRLGGHRRATAHHQREAAWPRDKPVVAVAITRDGQQYAVGALDMNRSMHDDDVTVS